MQKRQIGKTGVEVHAIGFGGMPISIQGRPSEEEALKVLDAVIDAGTDFIDTANVYCMDDNDIGHNERLIAKAIANRGVQNKIKVATKQANGMPILPSVHGYGPLHDVERRWRIGWEAGESGMWVNRYGYLSEPKLKLLKRVTSQN